MADDIKTAAKPQTTTADTLRQKSRDAKVVSGGDPVAKTGKSAAIDVWVDPREYAPGTKAQTMYK
ncbi:MAG: hypothetical protein KGL11_00220 [Alphaproteobacteria bacterium]|nr:hypothetical protein [Alphaproteobacteria bacterium]